MSAHPDVSVVLPVHNTMPDLRDCMSSLVEQDIGRYTCEVVAVDDGSTDGSGELLDEYAARYPNVRVIHQENHGWPGQPRNVGIAASSGRYVFFMDADDELGPESLRRQLRFADRHTCDVVVPKIVASGRPISSVWSESRIDADLFTVFRSLSPQKLFRRSFLDAHDIRFPEGVVPLEDGLVLARAYLLAGRVSVLADYDYYRKHQRVSGENISLRGKEPAPYADSVTRIIDIVREHATDHATGEQIALDVYRRKVLKFLRPERFGRYRQWRREAWVKLISELAATRISTELEARLPLDARMRSLAARSGDVSVVIALVDALNSGGVPAEVRAGRVLTALPGAADGADADVTEELAISARLVSAAFTDEGCSLQAEVDTYPIVIHGSQVELMARTRGTGAAEVSVPMRARTADDGNTASGCVTFRALGSRETRRWDVYVRVVADDEPLPLSPARLAVTDASSRLPGATVTAARHWVEPYVARDGNLSIATGAAGYLRVVRTCEHLLRDFHDQLQRQRHRVIRRLKRSAHWRHSRGVGN